MTAFKELYDDCATAADRIASGVSTSEIRHELYGIDDKATDLELIGELNRDAAHLILGYTGGLLLVINAMEAVNELAKESSTQ